MSGGGGKSQGHSRSESGAEFNQDVWEPQGQALQDLYGNANQLWRSMINNPNQLRDIAGQQTQWMQNIGNQAMAPWMQQMQGGRTGAAADRALASLMPSMQESLTGPSEMSQMYANIVGGRGNTYVDPLVEGMKRSSMDNLNRYVMPGINDAAQMASQSGSSRQGIAEGLAYADTLKNMMDKESELRAGAYDEDLNWKMDIARMADQGRGAAQDRALNLITGADQTSQSGMGFMPQMQNLGMGMMNPWLQASMAPWQQMGMYSNVIGAPTVLGSGSMSGSSKSDSLSHNAYGGIK